ncbi:phytanoyl-CoA dioxygenase family protein [Synechococcus sp. A15-24]|uniref:phytanoyl-CoA dioxygenase family protein n=1 Tax=Synechococcus sp. A15-24 TaxID=1050635 RepID=UPI00164632F3|nr:phytanoyl-CoA dioxygenase family protein [Synechococcus sp. A15-24]QNJ27819.1 phytanoyl-CoA dioxygenase family protein [Synechococcus sp. A15-24]
MLGDCSSYQNKGFLVELNALSSHELDIIQRFIVLNIQSLFKECAVPYESPLEWPSLINPSNRKYWFHNHISSKSVRRFTAEQVSKILKFTIFSRLRELLGEFVVSDEELIGYPDVYWRFVRPYEEGDIGPLHCDSWFWDLNPSWNHNSDFKKRTKVWIAILAEVNQNGLVVFPGSHNGHTFSYKVISSENKLKPTIVSPPSMSSSFLVPTNSTDAIIFHDKLLHGGSLNKGSSPRLSFEFTCLHN